MPRPRFAFVLVGCAVLANPISAPGQDCVSWRLRTTTGPEPRVSHTMVFDSVRNVSVLFGGQASPVNFDDTWEWDGISWTQMATSGPSARWGHTMAFDSTRGVAVLFGGYEEGAVVTLGDTWEWDGNTWTLRSTGGLTPRTDAAMAFDSTRGVTVLFGGYDGEFLGDTWEWDGNTWTLRSTIGPGRLKDHAMAYDSARGFTVLFGGNGNDTWEWDGSEWTLRQNRFPARRDNHSMAYDANRGVTQVFGGRVGGGSLTNELWEWDGANWIQRSPSGPLIPLRRFNHAMVYDSSRAVSIMFGGSVGRLLNGTWELESLAIVQPPQNLTVDLGDPVLFDVQVHGALTYQWRKDGVPLDDGGRISGATTPTLTIDPARLADAGAYDVVVANNHCTLTSPSATLTVNGILGDLNCDELFDGADIDPFFLVLGDTVRYIAKFPNCDFMLADMNQDGFVNGADIDFFFACLGWGVCP